MHFTGILLGFCTFLAIGVFHPIVIKAHYYFGTGCWWWFLLAGIAFAAASLVVESVIFQTILGVVAFSCFWSIKEVFDQQKRVDRGWFPANPKRKN